MAGGKGERLKADCEKPLFPLNDKFLIDYVLNNLNQSKYLDKIVIAVSPNT
ncbi:MAG: NTP transferase domain-containing protein, partial [archaeon]|nr:NTP transferase domain-containing protein [archaeon]